jgi:type IX secretion system PorP/SprF family membrane protein
MITNITYLRKPIAAAYILAILLCMAGTKAGAQVEPHFSQYYVYPAWLNPGLTGAIDGSYRITGIYRNQWGSVSSPFSTPGLSADFATNKNIGIGVNIMNQTAGTAGYNYMNGYISVAYTGLHFGSHQVSFGFSGGIISRRFDPSKFQFGDQWNPSTGYVPSNPGGETLDKTSSSALDLGAGVVYYNQDPLKKANLFAGFSAYHLTQPDDPFLATGSAGKLPVRYTAHAGVRLKVSETLNLIPNLLYMKQGTAEEKMAGLYAQYRVNETTDLLLGANYRWKDAIAPFAGIGFNRCMIGMSYDVNTSQLGKMAGSTGSFEMSFTYTGKRSAKARPTEFICPRL